MNEGVLTLESLRHKLAILGYDGHPKRFKPGEAGRERRVTLDSMAVLQLVGIARYSSSLRLALHSMEHTARDVQLPFLG